jgi:hypothetical protein
VRGAHDGPESIRPHGPGAVPIPARPMPHLLLIQPDLAFGLLTALFDGPAAADHLDRGGQGGRLRGIHAVRGALGRSAETPADQEPPTPLGLSRCRSGEPPPVIPSGAFGPVTRLHAAPSLRLQHRQERVDLPLAAGTPDLCLPRNRPDIRLGTLFQPLSQRSMLAIPTVPGHPGSRDGRVQRPLEPLPCQLRLAGKGALGRNPCACPALGIMPPRLGQRACAIQQDRALSACRG